MSEILKEEPSLTEWFNTAGSTCSQTPGADTGWDKCSTRTPGTYQTRIFPQRLPGLRRDRMLQTNAKCVRRDESLRRRAGEVHHALRHAECLQPVSVRQSEHGSNGQRYVALKSPLNAALTSSGATGEDLCFQFDLVSDITGVAPKNEAASGSGFGKSFPA